MENDKVAVLVSSCDKYEDAWIPFFRLFHKYWPQCKYDIYLNTEHKQFSMEGLPINNLNLKTQTATWSRRLANCLKFIKNDYILFFLDDFFLLDYVNESEINKAIKWLDSNPDVSCFQFYPNPQLLSVDDHRFDGYSLRDINGKWWLRCQVAIWRRKHLLMYLNPYENAWQFEEYGTNVAKLYNKKFYNLNDNNMMPFKYSVDRINGYGIYEGQWLESNVELFDREKISVDFDKLGLFKNGGKKKFSCPVSKKTFKERCMYFLHGGGETPYMSYKEQLKLFFRHPYSWLKMIYRKIVYFFSSKKYKYR